MAWEMIRSLEADIATLDKSVREMHGELCQVKNSTQHLCTMESQIAQELSYVHNYSTSIPYDCPLREPSSGGKSILEHIDNDRPMHDGENH